MEDLAVHPLSFSLAGMAKLDGAVLPLQEPLSEGNRSSILGKKNISKHSAPPQSRMLELTTLSPFISRLKGRNQDDQDLRFDAYQPLVLDWSFGHLYLPVLVCHNELQIGVQYPKILA